MPNKIDDFVPYRLLKFVETRLRLISKALAYNCDAAVFDNWDDFENSTAKYKLFFDATSGDTPVHFTGGPARVNQELTIMVVGVATYETEHPRALAMSLEQDARTALHTGFDEIRAGVGRGAATKFGRTSYDGGLLSPEKKAGFEFPTTFTWSQSENW